MDSNSTSNTSQAEKIYELGEKPPLGLVPENMHAFCVRQDRFGEPKDAWQREILPVPNIGPQDVLVYTMATGINYNNVWRHWAIRSTSSPIARKRVNRKTFTPAAAIVLVSFGR